MEKFSTRGVNQSGVSKEISAPFYWTAWRFYAAKRVMDVKRVGRAVRAKGMAKFFKYREKGAHGTPYSGENL
ncbi:MAG: hypothetical protein ACXWT4_09170 [Methylobacter sp.]